MWRLSCWWRWSGARQWLVSSSATRLVSSSSYNKYLTSVKNLNSKVMKMKKMNDKNRFHYLQSETVRQSCKSNCSNNSNLLSKRSNILTKIVVISNEAAILDTECAKLLYRGAHITFVTQVAHKSYWHQIVPIITSCDSNVHQVSTALYN